MARHPELEAAILADRHDAEQYRVYGDWLSQHGDPRGELIALHLANATTEAKQHLVRHPELAPQLGSSWRAQFEWSRGFVDAAILDDPSLDDFAAVIAHPACAFLRSLQVSINGDFAPEVIGKLVERASPIIDLVIHHTPIGFEIRDRPPLDDAFWDHVPHLRTLKLSNPGLFATLRHPQLSKLTIAGEQPFRDDVPWDVPALATLRWSDAGKGIDRLWQTELPGLRELRLLGKVKSLWNRSLFQLVPQLEVLAVPRTAIAARNGEAAGKLSAAVPQLRHLRELVVYSPTALPVNSLLRELPNLTWGA